MISRRGDEMGTATDGVVATGTSQWADVAAVDRLAVGLPSAPPRGQVVVPGSKSLTNRALLLAALAEGRSTLTGVLDAEDTALMVTALRRCGVTVALDDDHTTIVVDGIGGAGGVGRDDVGGVGLTTAPDPDGAPPLDVGTAGTVARFLGAVLAGSDGVHARLDGTPRMRERPLGQLFDALAAQGAQIDCHADDGFVPATIHGTRLTGGEVVLAEPVSSQIVSGLVFAALLATEPTRIVLTAGTPARPYVDMTLATIAAFGGVADWTGAAHGSDGDVIEVAPGGLTGRTYEIEPDASAATYVWGLAALHGGDLTVAGLGTASLQGDVAFAEVLARMGATVEVGSDKVRVAGTGRLRGIDVDLTELPDPGVTLAALAVRAVGETRIRGVAVHRHHETDRIAAAATELRKLGAQVVEHADGLDITPPGEPVIGVTIDTYDDHRMAMAFALVGGVVIDDPGCVAKTWPSYFGFLDRFGMVQS